MSRWLLEELQRDGKLPSPQGFGSAGWTIAAQVGDPLCFWGGPPISFMHLEKTAGTALADTLTGRFHPLQIDQDPNRAMPPHQRSPFPTSALTSIRERKLVWGHYDLPSLLRLGPERRIVTMLREPKARILSLYHYWCSIVPDRLDPVSDGGVKLAQKLDLLEFLRREEPSMRDSIDNLYVRRLTGLYVSSHEADPLAADPQRALANARLALDQLAFVGVVERMDESLAGLSTAIGTALKTSLDRQNAGESNAARQPTVFRRLPRPVVTPEIDAELERLTSLDRIIYAECLARIAERVDTHPV